MSQCLNLGRQSLTPAETLARARAYCEKWDAGVCVSAWISNQYVSQHSTIETLAQRLLRLWRLVSQRLSVSVCIESSRQGVGGLQSLGFGDEALPESPSRDLFRVTQFFSALEALN
jgi:hypothetical protein